MPFSFEKPPNGFSTGGLYSSPLRVYWQDERFWVYDRYGFLCSLQDSDALSMLLVHEAERPGRDKEHPFRPVGARAFLFPTWADEREAYHLALSEATGAATEQMKRGRIEEKPVIKLSLEDLGL
jgi:hypothetical protein